MASITVNAFYYADRQGRRILVPPGNFRNKLNEDQIYVGACLHSYDRPDCYGIVSGFTFARTRDTISRMTLLIHYSF